MSVGRSKLTSALWGGLFIAIISSVPGLNFVNCMCCSGVVGGGVLAVYLHSRKLNDNDVVSTLNGIELGLLSGLIGTLLSAIFLAVAIPHLPALLQQLDAFVDQRDLNEALEQLESKITKSTMTFIAIAGSLVVNVLFASIGGLMGVTFFGSDKKRAMQLSKNGADDSVVVEDIDF